MFSKMKLKNALFSALGSAILAFGLYQVHAHAGVTEGGILGLELLFDHWFDLSPAISSVVMNAVCYIIGFAILGREFIGYSVIATLSYSAVYAVCERFPPLWPGLAQAPLPAAVLGALFVGIGVGISVRAGGAPGGDDALAMGLSKVTKAPIERIYLIGDLSVLLLSLTYIPLRKIVFSLLTVLLSGRIIGFVQRFPKGLKQVSKNKSNK